MNRVLVPLKKMGLSYKSNNGQLPVTINKSILSNKSHQLEISSAQIKSAILRENNARIIADVKNKTHFKLIEAAIPKVIAVK